MKYNNMVEAVFINRPNRFTACVEINGKEEICHVKNTGRCRELFLKGARVYLEKSKNPNRKTRYDLITVSKNGELFNVDSNSVNKLALEYFKSQPEVVLCLPEYKFGNSRLDIFAQTEKSKILAEIKSVTLVNGGRALFPDAATERGVKHLKELQKAVREGYRAFVFFIALCESAEVFSPNVKAHPQFAEELVKAAENGVEIRAFNCCVKPDEVSLKDEIPVELL